MKACPERQHKEPCLQNSFLNRATGQDPGQGHNRTTGPLYAQAGATSLSGCSQRRCTVFSSCHNSRQGAAPAVEIRNPLCLSCRMFQASRSLFLPRCKRAGEAGNRVAVTFLPQSPFRAFQFATRCVSNHAARRFVGTTRSFRSVRAGLCCRLVLCLFQRQDALSPKGAEALSSNAKRLPRLLCMLCDGAVTPMTGHI